MDIDERINEVKDLIEQAEKLLEEYPYDVSMKLQLRSLEEHLKELERIREEGQ